MSYLLAKDEGTPLPRLIVVESLDEIAAHLFHGWRHACPHDVTFQPGPCPHQAARLFHKLAPRPPHGSMRNDT